MFRFLGGLFVCAASFVFVTQMSSSAAAACTNTITSIQQLQRIGSSATALAGNYCLGKTIPANGATIAPIGTSTAPFTGTFDGQGYEISGLTINDTGIYVGLFAYLGAGGQISNLGLTNVSVTAPSAYDVGGLVGRNSGTISKSYATGSITGTAGNTNGLNGIAVGGIAGWNFGTITQSYSAASVGSPGTGADLGGISGGNDGIISFSYSTGSVSSIPVSNTDNFSLGGLVGRNKTGSITQSYATGSITGGPNSVLGGLVATNDAGAGAVTNSYWDVQTTGQSSSLGGTGWTTAQLKAGLPSDFDPAVWGTNPGINSGYPYLLWQTGGIVASAPVITTNPTSQIVNAGQTATFTAAASGTPTPTVQWQQSTGAGNPFTNISGATSTTYSFTPTVAQSGYQYQAVFTNTAGTATTTAAMLTVSSPGAGAGKCSPATSPSPTSLAQGQQTQFRVHYNCTVSGNLAGDSVTIQIAKLPNGATFSPKTTTADTANSNGTIITITTSRTTPVGTYTLQVGGTGKTCKSYSVSFCPETFTIEPPTPLISCVTMSKVRPSLWWFNGVTPQPTNYVTTLQATTGATDYTWTITEGTQYAQFSNGSSTIDTKNKDAVEVSPKGDPGSGFPPTVTVAVQAVIKGVMVTSAPFTLNLKKPYKLLPNPAFGMNIVDSNIVQGKKTSVGYQSDVYYQIFDQTGPILPFDVPLNEQFTSGLINDYTGVLGSDWPFPLACGDSTHICKGVVAPSNWHDQIWITGIFVPPPQNPQNPLGMTLIDHWSGTWRIGDGQSGGGVTVQTNNWQRWQDHGRHCDIESPPSSAVSNPPSCPQ